MGVPVESSFLNVVSEPRFHTVVPLVKGGGWGLSFSTSGRGELTRSISAFLVKLLQSPELSELFQDLLEVRAVFLPEF